MYIRNKWLRKSIKYWFSRQHVCVIQKVIMNVEKNISAINFPRTYLEQSAALTRCFLLQPCKNVREIFLGSHAVEKLNRFWHLSSRKQINGARDLEMWKIFAKTENSYVCVNPAKEQHDPLKKAAVVFSIPDKNKYLWKRFSG